MYRYCEVFSLDTRSLALFRVGLALMILWDYAVRFQDLHLHYTDSGVLPRTALTADAQLSTSLISLHLASGSAPFEALLFVGGIIGAIALLLGYQTRLATFTSWILLASVQGRTPLMMQGDDTIRRLCLFWALFLPLGASFSFDKALTRYPIAEEDPPPAPKSILSFASVAFIAQLMMVYVFNALQKSDVIWHSQATALYYTLQIDHLVRPAGHALAGQTSLLPLLSRVTVPFELYVPFLLLIPKKNACIKLMVIFTFIIFHIGIAVTLAIGIFSATCIVFWLALLPGAFWDSWSSLAVRRGWKPQQSFRGYFDPNCDFCRCMVGIIREFFGLPAPLFAPSQDDPIIKSAIEQHKTWMVRNADGQLIFGFDAFLKVLAASPLRFYLPRVILRPAYAIFKCLPVRWAGNKIYHWIARARALPGEQLACLVSAPAYFRLSKIGQAFVLLSLLYVLLWNIRVLRVPLYGQSGQAHWYDRPAIMLRLDQKWTMFAPYPQKNDGWYVIVGTRNDGLKVNLLHPGEVITFRKPVRLEASFGNYRRRQYLMALALTKYARYRLWFARYLRRAWDGDRPKPEQLRQIDLYFVLEPTPLPGARTKTLPILMHRYNCASDSGETLPSGLDWEAFQIQAAQKHMVRVR